MIAVTGVGAVSALGADARTTFERIAAGERGLTPLSLFEPGDVRSRLVAEVKARFVAGDGVSRTSELALAAAREALADAGLDIGRRRVGLVLGGTTAGMFETESILATLASGEASRDSAVREGALAKMLSHPLSAPTDRLARELGPFVRARSLSSACSSGANALAVGAAWLELGLADAVLCGGADALCRTTFSGFHALQAVDPEGARPFDVRRRGMTVGEGAGFVVLERVGPGDARRARATLLGWAASAEAHHITNPEPTGEAALRAIRAALARAGLSPSAIDYVNAHGTGTPLNDAMEAGVLARLFGEEALRVPVSSQKGMIGHTLAAAGAIEAVLTVLAIERGILLPTGGLEEPDPAFSLRHVRRTEKGAIRAAISSSFGFGGMDTALVFGPADGAAPSVRPPAAVVVTGITAVTPRGIFEGTAVADAVETPLADEALDVVLPEGALDEERARRLDRTSRMAAVACQRALGAESRDAGVVLGIAFGAIDATAEYMRRLRDKGPRLVRPADFPGLVPSSPAGYASIYLGLRGPAFVVGDLAVSGECAVAQAAELIAAGMAERVCAAAIEERSKLVEEVLSVVFNARSETTGARREGGAAIALASESAGLPALARLGAIVALRGDDAAPLAELPPPPVRAVVVLPSGEREFGLVQASSWRAAPRLVCAPGCGTHEAAGAIAIAVAAGKVARGDVDGALFVGSARGYGYAGTVWPAAERR